MSRTIAARSRPARPLLSRARRLGEDGVSAVEFALIAPILFLSLLAMVDIGFAIHERMTIDHVLRAGAQEAMFDPGVVHVLKVLNTTAAKSFPAGADAPVFKVERNCACPQAKDVWVDCSTTCAGPTPTYVYYRLSGAKTYEGMIFNGQRSFGRDWMVITLAPTLQVQVR
jgi:pilus assembly protein CpaE